MRCFVLDEDGVRCPRIVIRKIVARLVATLVSPWGMRMIHGRMSARDCTGSSSKKLSGGGPRKFRRNCSGEGRTVWDGRQMTAVAWTSEASDVMRAK